MSRLRSTNDRTGVLVPSGIVTSDWSWAEMLKLPSAFRITRKVPEPLTSCAAAGSDALASVLRILIVWVIEVTRVQVASHALTVTRKGIPAVWGDGAPVLPEGVPGAADSPGSNTCS